MAKRMLLKPQDRRSLFDIPTDEDSLIRHFTLSPSDRLEIEVRRRAHNRLNVTTPLQLNRKIKTDSGHRTFEDARSDLTGRSAFEQMF